MLTVQQVGRFELRDFLGRGALGDVYLAWDPEAQREVALKVVRANRADPEMLQAEKNGVALQRQLSSVAPQVAAVYEWGEDAPFFWVALEYVAGDDLSQRLARGPLPEDRAAEIYSWNTFTGSARADAVRAPAPQQPQQQPAPPAKPRRGGRP